MHTNMQTNLELGRKAPLDGLLSIAVGIMANIEIKASTIVYREYRKTASWIEAK